METKKRNDTIQSLETGMAILDIVERANNPLKFSEIQEASQITKSNLYKYLNTLVQLNLLNRDKSTGQYHLGNQLIKYGMAAIGSQDYIALVTPYLQYISQYSNNTVIFSVGTNRGPVIAKIWHSQQTLNIGAQLGTLLPPSSSSGKIFSTFSNQMNYIAEIENAELSSIKSKRIAFAKEPLVESISSMSVPVFAYDKELAGIITVVGFSKDIPSNSEHPVCHYLLETQKVVSELFGYTEDN